MQLDNKTARVTQPRCRIRRWGGSVTRVGRFRKSREIGRKRRLNPRRGRRDDAAVLHLLDELGHVLIERRVLLVERDSPLQEADTRAEIVTDQRLETALECLERRGLLEILE